MNTSLTVDDPLADQEVTIMITLAAGKQSHDERRTLVSLGIAEQMPVIKTGIFGDVLALINEAWTTFGVQAQLAATAAQSAGQETELVADEQVVATASTGGYEQASTLQPQPTAPKPQAKNLSLF